MTRPKTIGFPRMMKEAGEKRVFLPEFIQFLTDLGAQVFVEEGYGARSGFSFADYQQANPKVECAPARRLFNRMSSLSCVLPSWQSSSCSSLAPP
jgi:alanine dehydrogenase